MQCEDEGVRAAATVGLRVPIWAAAPSGTADRELVPAWRPGTINIIVSVPVPLSDAAYVNAVMTATEAKTQAVLDAGFRASGTASDAICVAAPATGEPEDFAGPRSLWGARIARAVHSAVHTGAVVPRRRPARHRDGPARIHSAGVTSRRPRIASPPRPPSSGHINGPGADAAARLALSALHRHSARRLAGKADYG